jgi:hypothetical protein
LDGRNISVPGYEKGNFVGPTILTDVKVTTNFIMITFIINLGLNPFFTLLFKTYDREGDLLL